MADEQNDDLDELNLDIEPEEEEKSEKKGSSKSKLVLIIIIAGVVLAGGGGAAFFMMGGSDETEAQTAAVTTDKAKAITTEKKTPEGESQIKGKAIYVKLEPSFDVSIQDKAGKKHYLQIGITLMTRDETLVDVIKTHKPLITNDLLALISSQNFDDLLELSGKKKLRTEALKVVKEVVRQQSGKENVEAVLFTKFVME